jgi:hypothetical protein
MASGGGDSMGIRWGGERARHKHSEARRPADPGASATTGTEQGRASGPALDLPVARWTERIAASTRSAELLEELQARRAREVARSDLRRLRTRHWSPERVVEEGRIGIDFWEHHEADPYAVLSLLPGATIEEAAAARRRIAQQCHPDRLTEDDDADEALRRMVAANAAYDRLRRALRTA